MKCHERRTLLFVSPHLDDVAFSCGGSLIAASRAGEKVILCTVFTQTPTKLSPFAFELQRKNDIAPDVDYMALRRSEDIRFVQFARIREPIWLDFPDGPVRGYSSIEDLFGKILQEDIDLEHRITRSLSEVIRSESVSEVYAPACNGGHVDHRIVRAAVINARQEQKRRSKLYFYEEIPYALRRKPSTWKPGRDWIAEPREITELLRGKITGMACYRSQIPSQFKSRLRMKIMTGNHARRIIVKKGQKGAFELLWLAPNPGEKT